MSSNDESQDRELLERYRQASLGDSAAPNRAVREAIFEEGRRAAQAYAQSAKMSAARTRPAWWRLTALATAASVLLGALILVPTFLKHRGGGAELAPVTSTFKQAAARKSQSDAADLASTPPVPVMPLQQTPAAPASQSERFAARQRNLPAPPPVPYPEQNVEISMLNRSRSAAATVSTNGATPKGGEASAQLLSAAAAGDTAHAAQLLEQSTFVDVRDAAGRTPLMLAVDGGRLETVQLLLQRGADPNAVDRAGLTPLKHAQQSGREAAAAILTQAGAR